MGVLILHPSVSYMLFSPFTPFLHSCSNLRYTSLLSIQYYKKCKTQVLRGQVIYLVLNLSNLARITPLFTHIFHCAIYLKWSLSISVVLVFNIIYYRGLTWANMLLKLLIALCKGKGIISYSKQSPQGLLWLFRDLISHTPWDTLTCSLLGDIWWLTLITQESQGMRKGLMFS